MFAIVVICIELMLIVEFKHFEKYEIVGMDSGSPNSQSIQVKWIKCQLYWRYFLFQYFCYISISLHLGIYLPPFQKSTKYSSGWKGAKIAPSPSDSCNVDDGDAGVGFDEVKSLRSYSLLLRIELIGFCDCLFNKVLMTSRSASIITLLL